MAMRYDDDGGDVSGAVSYAVKFRPRMAALTGVDVYKLKLFSVACK